MPSIFLDFERALSASPNDVRNSLDSALHDLGFVVTTEHVTLIEAKRGHPVMGSMLGAGSVPVQVTANIVAQDNGSRVTIRLADHLASIGRSWGANTAYQRVFGEIQQRIDDGLARLDPGAATGFAPAEFHSKAGTIRVLESTNRVTSGITSSAFGKVNQMLSGGPRTRVPEAWKQLDTVVLSSDEGAARLQLEELQAHLAIAMLISSQPGSLPPALTAQVEALAARIESAVNAAGESRYVEIPISDEEEPVVEFLHQQARMRQRFAVRTLHRCRTCKFEKITNPDLERLQKRNTRLRSLGGSVGATFGKAGISPFILVGTLLRFANLDPDYICPRCQGTDAEAMVVTFCPECGALRTEAALRTCAKCHVDMRTKITPDHVWAPYPDPPPVPAGSLPAPVAGGPIPIAGNSLPLEVLGGPLSPGPAVPPASVPDSASPSFPTPPPPPPPPAPPAATGAGDNGDLRDPEQPAIGPNGGKVCAVCGGEFPMLYRAVVDSAGGRHTMFVCARTRRCAPQSVVPPVPV